MRSIENVARWFEQHRFVVDATLTGAALLLVWLTGLNQGLFDRSSGIAALAWSAGVVLPLAWRRTYPVVSAVAVYAFALGHLLAGFPVLVADLGVLVALWSVTVYGPRWAYRTAICSTVAGTFLIGPIMALQWRSAEVAAELFPISIFFSVVGLAVWAFALARRNRRVTVDTLRDRAERLELERDQQARIATAAERARIAREMHDIVAHSLSIVVAQADGGRYAASSDPAAAVRALGVVSETGRAALADMRRLLGVLRDDESGTPVPADGLESSTGRDPASPVAATPRRAGDAVGEQVAARGDGTPAPAGNAPLRPQPDDADLSDLVAQARDAGMRVSLVRIGVARRLPPGAGLTLHRVGQEALSNVRKHAGPDPAVTVVVRWAATTVELEISDDGRGASSDSADAGYGLLGMRERATLFDGTVTAGPRPGGGWRVRFTMPVPAAPEEDA